MMQIQILIAIELVAVATALFSPSAEAQDTPYFVTYSHHLEQPDNLDIEFNPVFGIQRSGNGYLAGTTEFEYGVKAWWPRSSTSTDNRLSATARSSPASVGRTVSLC